MMVLVLRATKILVVHSVCTLLGIPCYLLRGMDSTICWKYSFKILVGVEEIPTDFSGGLSGESPDPKSVPLDSNLATGKAIEDQ